ncbi:rCG56217 [Rattus norvegicus]|uniref:RCG56217 n=1 Tax=Rattus norvegicus TaxID=10116 RepID=A6IAT6_RAT|nr:rCG56217 [Rattus norvegicus]
MERICYFRESSSCPGRELLSC